MASILSTKSGNTILFPPALTNEMFNLVRGKSSLARLSGQDPIPSPARPPGPSPWTMKLTLSPRMVPSPTEARAWAR